MNHQPLVSVSMITYRHEEYIEEAILGVLMQQTCFEFELILSNDNSPDNSDQIIRRILDEHPRANCVRYIRHAENIGIMQNALDNLERCCGEYIAFCEGDDVWINPLKLQIQIDALRHSPECDLCFHPAQVFCGNQKTDGVFAFHSGRIKVFSTEAIVAGGGDFCPTAAIIIRRSIFEQMRVFLKQAPVGDYFLQVAGSVRGGALYLPQIMSVYRRDTAHSWTSEMRAIKNRVAFYHKITTALIRFDAFLNGEYRKSLNVEMERQYIHVSLTYLGCGLSGEYKLLFEEYSRLWKINFRIKSIYWLGMQTGSVRIVSLIDKLFFAHPNILIRALKRGVTSYYLKRQAFADTD